VVSRVSACQACMGERQEPFAQVRYSVRSKQWLCTGCWLDELAWVEDMHEDAVPASVLQPGDSGQLIDNTPTPITP
jgi:hypothetical protein